MHIYSLYIPQSVITWIIVGLIAGWLAGTVSRGRGFGCLADIIIGMVGAILGGWIFLKLGILGGGLIYSIAAATVGAVLLVGVASIFSGNK
ncbi:MAG TPA: GlsB/YeaQ/YmgE family stress response membrane protein [Candidatus Acidoferrales bacterium]|nr:GlsB/YeaQ/YmgE family stress response membrane protein [Candidatus Acidoferrales bacterium]